jgi:hypothetical protein
MAVEAEEIIALAQSLGKKHSREVMLMASLRLFTKNLALDNSFITENSAKSLADTANTCIAANCTLLGIASSEVDAAYEGFVLAGKIANELNSLPE